MVTSGGHFVVSDGQPILQPLSPGAGAGQGRIQVLTLGGAVLCVLDQAAAGALIGSPLSYHVSGLCLEASTGHLLLIDSHHHRIVALDWRVDAEEPVCRPRAGLKIIDV